MNLSADPISITVGESTTIRWSSTNADQCTSAELTTNNQTSGNISLQPETSTTYTVSCSASDATTGNIDVQPNYHNELYNSLCWRRHND